MTISIDEIACGLRDLGIEYEYEYEMSKKVISVEGGRVIFYHDGSDPSWPGLAYRCYGSGFWSEESGVIDDLEDALDVLS